MSDIHALSGAYAIDALDDVERARFERHLAACEDCQAEVRGLRETAALLPETAAALPPAALRDRILGEIDTVRPLPPTVVATPRRTGRRVAGLVAAAAALVAIGGIGATVWHPWSDDASQGDSVATQVLNARDATSWSQNLDGGATVRVTRSNALNKAIVQVSGMAPAGDGRVYQLWLQHGSEMVSAGLMPDRSDTTVVLEGDAASADGFGITREPGPDGSDKPTRPPVALIDFAQA